VITPYDWCTSSWLPASSARCFQLGPHECLLPSSFNLSSAVQHNSRSTPAAGIPILLLFSRATSHYFVQGKGVYVPCRLDTPSALRTAQATRQLSSGCPFFLCPRLFFTFRTVGAELASCPVALQCRERLHSCSAVPGHIRAATLPAALRKLQPRLPHKPSWCHAYGPMLAHVTSMPM